jgi:hypothetical protein
MRPEPLLRAGLTAGILLGLSGLGLSQGQGVKQTEKLLKQAGETVKAVSEGRAQVQKTLDTYNSLVQGKAEDPKKAYKNLQKEMERCDDRVADVQRKRDEMQVEADKYFGDWNSSLAGISDPGLRKQSEDRLSKARAQYDGILEATEAAGADFKPFMTSLKDQVVYLGHDLNPAALKSLAGTASKLNGDATALFGKIDGAVSKANSYITAFKPAT